MLCERVLAATSSDGETALHIALSLEDGDTTRLLLAHGAAYEPIVADAQALAALPAASREFVTLFAKSLSNYARGRGMGEGRWPQSAPSAQRQQYWAAQADDAKAEARMDYPVRQ